MSNVKKSMYLIAALSLVFMFTFYGLFVRNHNDVCYAMGIIFMTIAYHVIVRLVIGTLIDVAFDNQFDGSKSWFEDSDAERAFYKLIGVRKWKNKLPTFDSAAFSIKNHSLEDLVGTSCQAEVVHEVNIAASLLAMLFAIPFGSMWLFALTSILGALVDLVFVIVQRYNRPRLMRAAERQRRIFFEKLAYEEACEENSPQTNDNKEQSAEKSEGGAAADEDMEDEDDGTVEDQDIES